MSLAAGTKLGPYEIVAPLGAGGMGEVWRASDTRLKRQVAIKMLPAAFVSDRERLARFEREAQLLASLNHPNIAAIYGIEESGGTRALVMELVEGEDLAERILRGALPTDEAIPVARQIAEALEAAHEQGIVHRDLKPANVKLRPDGTVKVLDFGLAKAAESPVAASGTNSPTLMHSPTLTAAHGTALGVILGTAAYMAPEQAKGRPVDKRADIWAFGVVLYEMLAGRRLFTGEDASDVLAAVLRQEIDLAPLPATTPPRVRRLVARCLERDPKARLRDIGEARLILAGPEEPPVAAPVAVPVPARRGPSWAIAVVAALAASAGTAVLLLHGGKNGAASAPKTTHLSIALAPGEQVTSAPAISPDGRAVAYVAGRSLGTARLYVRSLGETVARPIDSSGAAMWPSFSPDGRSVAFFAGGKLWRAPVAGGTATALAHAPRGWGASWGPDDRIVYAPSLNDGLWELDGASGANPLTGASRARATQITEPDDDANGYAHVFPQRLPNGDTLFTIWGREFRIALYSPATKAFRDLMALPNSRVALWSPSGHLLLGDLANDLIAAPWRPGDAAPARADQIVISDVYWLPGTDKSWNAVAENGTAIYVPGDPGRRRLAFIDRDGRVEILPGDPDQTTHAVVSRDGRRVVYNGRGALWVRDLETGTRTRIASEVRAWVGGWLPGDEKVVLSSNKTGDWELYTLGTSGGALEPLLKRPRSQHPLAVAPDGTVIYIEPGLETGNDLWTLSPSGETAPLVVSPARDWSPSVSPDGRWVAYMSDEAGRDDVYVVPLQGGAAAGRQIVSIDGGTGPVWTRDGRELLYRAGDDLMSVEVRALSPQLVLGERRRLLDVSAFDSQFFHEFDVSADGRRFLFLRADPEARPTRIDVILDWFPELRSKLGS